ncbi:LamG domain-containing protein [Candidatus Poribacteria bacterium]|nr:LamG domain-containing protein [Candidatus Poribacteria bacterium]
MKLLYFLLVLMLVFSSLAIAELLDGLVLYMPLDEGTGKEALDVSGNGFKGMLNGGAKWVDGEFGKALEFSTSTDFVAIEDDKAFHIEDEITQAAWVNLSRLPSAHAIVFGTREGGGGRNIGFGYGMNPSNGIKVWTNGAGGGFLDVNDNATKLDTKKWYYLSYTHTSDNKGKVKIYVDGKVTHEQDSNNPVAPAGTTGRIQIGTWSGEAWPGMVDEVRLWNRALSDKEMEMSMEMGMDEFLAVNPQDKLTTSWGKVKRQR